MGLHFIPPIPAHLLHVDQDVFLGSHLDPAKTPV